MRVLHMSTKSGAMVAALAVAVTLTGCGETKTANGGGAAVEDYMNGSATDDYNTGPMAEYFGFGDSDQMSAQLREQTKRQQAAMVECMRAEGFEYIAFDSMGDMGADDFDPYGGMTRKEYTAKWGWGVSTTIDADGQPIDDAPGYGSTEDLPEDPNQKIRDALSPEDQLAYDKAMFGDMADPTTMMSDDGSGSTGSVDGSSDSDSDLDSDLDSGEPDSEGSDEGEGFQPDFSQMGCSGRTMTDSLGMDQTDMEAMTDAEEEMTQRVDADKRVKAAAADYRACMKAAGYPNLTEPGDAQSSIEDRMNEMWEADSGDFDGSDSGSGSTSDIDSGDTEGGDGGSVESAGLDAAKLKKLQRDEIELAVAELPCDAEYQVATQKVRFEEEQRFIDENPELVARMKKSFGG